jgi:hypothetical protein
MAKRKKNSQVKDYRHDEKRKNNPPIGMVSYEPKVGEPKMKRYAYDPHLSPQLGGLKSRGSKRSRWSQVPTFDTVIGQEAIQYRTKNTLHLGMWPELLEELEEDLSIRYNYRMLSPGLVLSRYLLAQ